MTHQFTDVFHLGNLRNLRIKNQKASSVLSVSLWLLVSSKTNPKSAERRVFDKCRAAESGCHDRRRQ